MSGQARSMGADCSGASAVEFGVLAPVIAFAFLSMIDVGMAIRERMIIDSGLRAGAQAALTDPGADDLVQMVSAVMADDFTVSTTSGEPNSTELLVDAERFCACPENVGTAVSCTTPACTDADARVYVYYRLEAAKNFDAALLPQISLRSNVLVQVQ